MRTLRQTVAVPGAEGPIFWGGLDELLHYLQNLILALCLNTAIERLEAYTYMHFAMHDNGVDESRFSIIGLAG